tara:strand:- start:353 stop:505 length:153 start_codon:yes stop_codon:yes gene_type:complete
MMTTIVMVWVGLVAAVIIATYAFLLRLSDQTEDDANQWRPSRAYKWDATD